MSDIVRLKPKKNAEELTPAEGQYWASIVGEIASMPLPVLIEAMINARGPNEWADIAYIAQQLMLWNEDDENIVSPEIVARVHSMLGAA